MIFGLMGYQAGDADVADSLGFVYAGWGHCAKALEYYEKSLAVRV
jgi:hypothetical protein